jgi:hypothetical protein
MIIIVNHRRSTTITAAATTAPLLTLIYKQTRATTIDNTMPVGIRISPCSGALGDLDILGIGMHSTCQYRRKKNLGNPLSFGEITAMEGDNTDCEETVSEVHYRDDLLRYILYIHNLNLYIKTSSTQFFVASDWPYLFKRGFTVKSPPFATRDTGKAPPPYICLSFYVLLEKAGGPNLTGRTSPRQFIKKTY